MYTGNKHESENAEKDLLECHLSTNVRMLHGGHAEKTQKTIFVRANQTKDQSINQTFF